MARPHPVIRIGAELTYGAGRSGYQTHIAEYLFGKHVVFIAAVERLDFVFVTGAGSRFLAYNFRSQPIGQVAGR